MYVPFQIKDHFRTRSLVKNKSRTYECSTKFKILFICYHRQGFPNSIKTCRALFLGVFPMVI